jgi:hypothetical protein
MAAAIMRGPYAGFEQGLGVGPSAAGSSILWSNPGAAVKTAPVDWNVMIPRYLLTLATTVFVVTLVFASLPFATSSQVLSGQVLNESPRFEFTIDADSTHTYKIDPELAQFLQTNIAIHTDGPPQVMAANLEVTARQVSWTENRQTITAPGAALSVQLRWDTPAGTANGSHGDIYMTFPEIPGLEGKKIDMRSGPYQLESGSHYVVREVTTYQNNSLLSLARIVFAFVAGIPFGILLHTLARVFVMRREKRRRISGFPPQSSGLPQTFYPDPVAEWTAWLFALGIGGATTSLIAGFSVFGGFMSSSFMVFVYSAIGITATAAILITYIVSRRALTVRVEPGGIFYARGRENAQWLTAAWSDVLSVTQKSRTYRGGRSYWIEIAFRDGRKTLKIGQSIVGYATLRGLLVRTAPQ